jgi:asparagine synthase (glutamine-hydrolysing)
MCGICGKYSTQGVGRSELEAMARAIAHRGPDDEGFFLDGPVGLASRRLSIIDLETGHQPLSNEDGSCWIVFNGEIYNYRQLRGELEAGGHVFATESDTEIIVHLYEEEGERCVERLDGMFALAIWDKREEKLLLARDPLGQKPLFYRQTGGDLVFGSEVKAILAAERCDRKLDHQALHHYLSLRFIPAPRTMFEGISKLPPGHRLVFQRGQTRLERYWKLDFRNKLTLSEEELVEALRERLRQTVNSHLVSDVPVGALLSGGMDSSMVVALMAEARDGPVQTFSIGVREQSINELPFARQVAGFCGTRHIEGTVEADLMALLPEMIFHLDEPSDPVAACMYHAAELASRHVKVVLGGDGGDELFAGFDRYLGLQRLDRFGPLAPVASRLVLAPLAALLPESFAYKSSTQKLRWLGRVADAPSTAERYAEATLFFRFSHQQKQELFTESLWRDVGGTDSSRVLVDAFSDAPATELLDRMLYTDYVTRLPEHSLMLTDRMSMAHGLEVRSPLVDHDLTAYLASFPASMKIRSGELKVALRRAAEGYLPKEIVRRQKQGFMFPVAYWFEGELQPFLRTTLSKARSVADGIFRAEALTRLLDDHRARKIDNHVRIWMILNFEIWYRLYVEGSSVSQVRGDLIEDLEATRGDA